MFMYVFENPDGLEWPHKLELVNAGHEQQALPSPRMSTAPFWLSSQDTSVEGQCEHLLSVLASNKRLYGLRLPAWAASLTTSAARRGA
ncbi:hypothetical protein BST61_g8955 [Cercospora zeina]